ncbi:MAG: valine--tRNA ligase [Planctomycetia bacterium]|nr:valine--tRNA ligase [Planctomycetia bacterium]
MTFTESELPKQYDHLAAQKRWYAFWESRGYFRSDPDPKRRAFSIVIPPPNVTGALHLGHALNNTNQDITIRFKRMQGFNTLWMPGTDHAGIATQAVVERRILQEEKKSRHDLGREALVARIWAWKEQYEARIISQLKEMGCSCDWRRTRFTFDEVCARAVRHTFFRLFKAGLIFRGLRLVNWDTFLQTAVSDDEVFQETVQGNFWHIRYPVIDRKPGEPEHVVVATTRPETMLGDTAVAVHPDPAAALDKAEAELRAKLAGASEKEKQEITGDLEAIAGRRETHLPGLLKLRDMARAGRKVMLPLLNRPIPLVADEWAKPELGSGCVKITPGHDPNDYDVGLRQKLPMIDILTDDGQLNENAGPYKGLSIADGRNRVVADLEKLGLIEQVEERQIELPMSDRSKTPIEPRRTLQWFVKMESLAQSAMDAVEDGRVRIIPERFRRSYLDWLSEKRDWPVSRQLWWGHRIPVWREPQNVPPDVAVGFIELRQKVEELADKYPDKVSLQPFESFRPPMDGEELVNFTLSVCVNHGAEDIERQLAHWGYTQDPDVLDTWFSSALWPHSTMGWPDLKNNPPLDGRPDPAGNGQNRVLDYYYPTSVLMTGRDILSLWVARMVLTGLFNVGDVPFREVYLHPKILDGYGETMSKSKGNGVDPLDIIQLSGADALRFGLAHLTTETQDVRVPVEFKCPDCEALVEQTRANRVLARVKCSHCGKPFSTQWAEKPEDTALPRGLVVSERFELGRNFCNKFWNASRFALLNLEGYAPAPVTEAELTVEDRWLLSRLSSVTAKVTSALEKYEFGEAARALYDFAWDEFCSFYVEMVKYRLNNQELRPAAQRVLAHALDALLRLLHPIIPFVTEEVWQLLAKAAPARGLAKPEPAAPSVMIATWPQAGASHQDAAIEARFARFQEVLKGLRDVRARQNIAPKQRIEFVARCDDKAAALLKPMEPYFESMAGAKPRAWGQGAAVPSPSASFTASGIEIFVDLAGLIDVSAEIAKNEKERARLLGLISGKEKKLSNEAFVSKAPPDVVQKERASLSTLQASLRSTEKALDDLRKRG